MQVKKKPYLCGNKNREIMFTVANQLGNNITRTSTQTVKHSFYSNQEFSIVGLDNFKLWRKIGTSLSILEEFNTLEEAIEAGNKLISTL